MQAQIQALIIRRVVVEAEEATKGSNTRSNIEIAKLLVFNREVGKIGGLITVCKLYLRIKIREAKVEEQI